MDSGICLDMVECTQVELENIPLMKECCDQHGYCYEQCGQNKTECDMEVQECAHNTCIDAANSDEAPLQNESLEGAASTLINIMDINTAKLTNLAYTFNTFSCNVLILLVEEKQ